MCFRPTSAGRIIKCSNCGKEISLMPGTVQKKCPFCKAELKASDNKDQKK